MTEKPQHTIKEEIKANIELSSPLVAAWVVYSMSGFIGTAMVARISQEALAASVLVNTLWMSLTVAFFGIFNSVSVLVAHQYGARNHADVGKVISQAFLIGVVVAIPIMLAMYYSPYIAQFATPGEKVLILVRQYAHTMMLAVPGVIGLIILENFLNGIGKTRLSLWISLIEVPIEIFLIYIFVFGKFGAPAFGLAGVGIGLAVSFVITVLVLILYLSKARFAQKYQVFKYFGELHLDYLKEMLRIGVPVGLMYAIEVIAIAVATFMMAHFDTVTLAAHQITMQFLGVTINIAFAMGQAVSIRVGHYVGQEDKPGVILSTYVGIALSFAATLLVVVGYLFFPHWLLHLDIDTTSPKNADLVKIAVVYLAVLGLFQLFDTFRILSASALRALKDTKFPMYVSLISFWPVALGLSYLLSFRMNYSGVGIWYGLTAGVFIGAIILLFRLKSVLSSIDLANIKNIK